MYTLDCYNTNENTHSFFFLKPSKTTSIGRKSSEIKFNHKLISRANHCDVIAGDVDVTKRDDIQAKYPLTIHANKKAKVVKPDSPPKMLENSSTEIEHGDIIYLANQAIAMTVIWRPIHFNVSSLFTSKSSFNSETLCYAEKGLKFGRGHWKSSYDYLVHPERSLNTKVLAALTSLKPIVNRGYLESVYQSILSDNIDSILPTVTSDHLPSAVSNEKIQSDAFWLISESRLRLFSGHTFYVIVDLLSSAYIDILTHCGASVKPINTSIKADNVASAIERTCTKNTQIILPTDVSDRLLGEGVAWSNAISQAAQQVGIQHMECSSVNRAIMEIDVDCLEAVPCEERVDAPRHESQPSSSSRAPSQEPSQSRKRKALDGIEEAEAPKAPQRKLIKRSGAARVHSNDLDDDGENSTSAAPPAQEKAETVQLRQPQQPVKNTTLQLGKRAGARRALARNIDDSDDDDVHTSANAQQQQQQKQHEETSQLQQPEEKAEESSPTKQPQQPYQPHQQQSTLRRRANTRRMQTINIDDSDEEPFPAPQPTAPQVSSPAPTQLLSQLQSHIPPPTPQIIQKRKTARERVEEQMAAPQKHDFLNEHMMRRKKTLLEERNAKVAAQHARIAEQEVLAAAQRQASRVPESVPGSKSGGVEKVVGKEAGKKGRKGDDFDDDLQLDGSGFQRALGDCIIPMKLIPLRRRDEPGEKKEKKEIRGDRDMPNYKKFRRKIDHIYQPRVAVGLLDRNTNSNTKPTQRPRKNLMIDVSSDDDELADKYFDQPRQTTHRMTSLFKRLGIASKDLQSGISSRELDAALVKDPKTERRLSAEQVADRNLERFYGMDNLGNTCYCNSVLQSLYFCRPLRELILGLPSDVDRSMYTVLRNLFHEISRQPRRTGVSHTKSFVDRLRIENELFRSTTHQDAHEFLNYLLNRVAEDLTRLTKSPHTLVHSLFEGTLTNETKCMTCENITHRDESFLDLSINVEEDSNVTECLSNFSTREMLCQKNKFFCDGCGGLQEAEKWMRIKKLPNILALHLKRFKYQEEQNRYIKLSYRVAFPFLLEPANLSSTCQGAENSDRMYSLFAVIIHIGSGPHHGHYVSIIKSYDRWVLFDDDKVSIVDEHELSKFFGNDPAGEGYVFFYETVHLDRGSVGLAEKPSPQVPLVEEEEDKDKSNKASYLKKKGSFSAPPSPTLTPLTSASKVNSTSKLNQVMTASEEKKESKDDKDKEKDKDKNKSGDLKRTGSQSSRKSLNIPFGLGADRVSSVGMGSGSGNGNSSAIKSKSNNSNAGSASRPISSGSLFAKKDKSTARPSTSHAASTYDKDSSWFGKVRLKSMSGSGNASGSKGEHDIPPEIPNGGRQQKQKQEEKRSRRRSLSAAESVADTKPTPPHSSGQFASGMSETFMKERSVSHGTANANPRNGQISPPPAPAGARLNAASVRREREQLEREKYEREKSGRGKRIPSPNVNVNTNANANANANTNANALDNEIGSSPMTAAARPSSRTGTAKAGKKNIFMKWMDKIRHTMNTEYDYVVIGGGTAGLVVAARLAEKGEKVLVVESGGDAHDSISVNAASEFVSHVGSVNDHAYAVHDAAMPMPRGRCLGGSSAINFLLWNKPHSIEIEAWEALGVVGWSWEAVLSEMRRAEAFLPPSSTQKSALQLPEEIGNGDYGDYGSEGPIALSYPPYACCTDKRWLATMARAGVRVNHRAHLGDNAGANVSPVTVDARHQRAYAIRYLESIPVGRGGMLDIRTHTTVDRIRLAQTDDPEKTFRGVAVECSSGDATFDVDVGKRVVLAAGAIATPAILEKSGIGDEKVLQERGYTPRIHLPGVGRYQGHYYVTVCYELRDVDAGEATRDTLRGGNCQQTADSVDPSPIHQAADCVAYLTTDDLLSELEKAVLSQLLYELESGDGEQRVLAQLYRNTQIPQVEVDMVGFFADTNGTTPAEGKQYVTFMVGCQHPVSRGSVHAGEHGVDIASNYNTHPIDRLILKAGIRFVRSVIAQTEPLREIIGREVSPGNGVSEEAFMAHAPACDYHPGCTARMGSGETGVVDSTLRVHGCENVFVADASVMPTQVSAHIQSLVYAIAERAGRTVMRLSTKIAVAFVTITLTLGGLYTYTHSTQTRNIVIPSTEQISRMNAESHDRYIVMFKETATDDEIHKYASQVESTGGKVTHPYTSNGIMKTFTGHIPQNLVSTLEGESPVEFVEKDSVVTTQ
ncbi:hypothetical protein E3P91_01753 [Wallemia ichthyophaga]|nr:hypothetical protein E3P91_01753 [Wallemia ichthyophaga]